MIAVLSGVVSEKLESEVVLDVKGVGYGLLVTAEDYNRLANGEETKLYVYEHIREQSHDLFGFLTRDTKSLFEQLLDVNGIGPKMALNMLSIGSSADLRAAIAGGDVRYIAQASGVGKRVAERVVVELKDKVGLIGVDLEASGLLQSESAANQDEAVEALVTLGFTVQDAAKALSGVPEDIPTAERIKKALANK